MSLIMPDFTIEPETLAQQFIDLGIDTGIEVRKEHRPYNLINTILVFSSYLDS